MKRLIAALAAFLFAVLPVAAQDAGFSFPPSAGFPKPPVTVNGQGAQGGTLPAPGANGNVLQSNGSSWSSQAPSGGGGGGPYIPPQISASLSTINNWLAVAVSPDSAYAYVVGKLTSNSDLCVLQINLSTGAVKSTLDLGVASTSASAIVSNDSAFLYVASGTDWFKIALPGNTVSHHSTLAVSVLTSGSGADLSADGTKYVYVSGANQVLYTIDTTTFAVTNHPATHSAGANNTLSCCFYDGSNANVYVAYVATALIDLYTTAGVYISTVDTTQTGVPAFNFMRSGVNHTVFIGDAQGALIVVLSGTPKITPLTQVSQINGMSVDSLSQVSTWGGVDSCAISSGAGSLWFIDSGSNLRPYANIPGFTNVGLNYCAIAQDGTERAFTILSGATAQLISLSGFSQPSQYATTGYTGSGTIGGGGTVTITSAPATTTSCIQITSTSAVPHPMSVTTRNNGSFVVTGTAADTFTWVVVKP